MKELLPLIIVMVVASVAFVALWRQGAFLRVSNYVHETSEELKKCSWPTWDELKSSTALVMISIALLGGFTVGVDFVIAMLVRSMY